MDMYVPEGFRGDDIDPDELDREWENLQQIRKEDNTIFSIRNWLQIKDVERFWTYVNLEGDCWNWKGSLTVRGGYGQLNVRHKVIKAHRISYALFYGDPDQDLFVCHKCDNPRCVNPSHLFLGTCADNTRDAWFKGRLPLPPLRQGTDVYCAKLTDNDVRHIKESMLPGVELAQLFGVSKSTISSIKKGKTWKHVE